MDEYGRLRTGGNSASREVKTGQQRLTQAAIAAAYQRRGGTYTGGGGGGGFGGPTARPQDPIAYRESAKEALAGLGNSETGYGVSGRGSANLMNIEDAYAEVGRRDRQDRAALEQSYKNREEDYAWEREKRNWQRDSWKKANTMSSGGFAGVGGSYGVGGLR